MIPFRKTDEQNIIMKKSTFYPRTACFGETLSYG